MSDTRPGVPDPADPAKTDALLAVGLRELPVPTPAPDFDARVLAGVRSAARPAHAPSGGQRASLLFMQLLAAPRPRLAVGAVGALVVAAVALSTLSDARRRTAPDLPSADPVATADTPPPAPRLPKGTAAARAGTAARTGSTTPIGKRASGKSGPKTLATRPPRRAESPPRVAPAVAAAPAPDFADDMNYLNPDPAASLARWSRRTRLSGKAGALLAAELERSVRGGDDFVDVPLPRVAAAAPRPGGGPRVEAAALAAYRRERQVVDARLRRAVTVGLRAMPLSELCRKLSEDTGVVLTAGRGVADDNVTLFCTARPLRDVMRQVADLFGFAWERTGEEGDYRYRLVQPLRAQLLEEELRNRDRDAALLALDREMRRRYQDLLDLSPEEARERAASASAGEERASLEKMGGLGWGPAQLYFALSPEETAALRAGNTLRFGESRASAPWGEFDGGVREQRPFPVGIEATLLRAQEQTTRVGLTDRGTAWIGFGPPDSMPGGLPPSAVSGARAVAELQVVRRGGGHFTLRGSSGVAVEIGEFVNFQVGTADLATGAPEGGEDVSPDNAKANAARKSEAWARRRVTLRTLPAAGRGKTEPATSALAAAATGGARPRATTAEMLEAVHRATGRDVIGDAYTRLYDADALSARDATLFDALCRVSDAARMRWDAENAPARSPATAAGGFLRFRTPDFYRRRPQEVPARLLTRWAAATGRAAPTTVALPLEEVLEMARVLSDEQLDAEGVAEGARALYGLAEWDLLRSASLRPALRFLSALPPGAAWRRGDGGDWPLPLEGLDPTAQRRFWALTFANNPPSARRPRPSDLLRASVVVAYTPERADPETPAELTVVFRYGGPGTGFRRHTYTRIRAWGEGDSGAPAAAANR